MPVLIAGTAALDDLKTPFGERKNILGGSAVHASVSASFFSSVRINAVIGADFPGGTQEVPGIKKYKIQMDCRSYQATRSTGRVLRVRHEPGPHTLQTDLNVLL